MPKLSKATQLKQALQRLFEYKLKYKLAVDNNPTAFQRAYIFSHALISNDINIANQFELVSSVILEENLAKATFAYLLSNLEKIPALLSMVDAVFEQVNHQFINGQLPCLTHELSSASAEAIRAEISGYLQDTFGEVDMREYDTHERNVRRMDSLARMFTLSSNLSACSAVTFYQGKLLIAANLDKESKRDEVISALKNRFTIVCEFIAAVKDMKTTKIPQVAEEFHSKLMAQGGSNSKKDIFIQAMCKFAHSIYKDIETFPKSFRTLFTEFNKSNYLIILPAVSPSNIPQLRLINYLESCDYVIEGQPVCKSIKLLHAEQLIAWYIFKINAESQETLELLKEEAFKLPLGISKLSCKTCQENLSTLALEIRGTHQQSYPEVIGLFTHSREPSNPDQQFKSALTFAKSSHPDTILDSSRESSLTSPAKKSLFSDSSDGSLSRPLPRTFSRVKSSRSHAFFSSQPGTLKEKEHLGSVSEPNKRESLASLSEYRYERLERKNREIIIPGI